MQVEIDNEVFDALKKRITGFNETPNDVLRCLLDLPRKGVGPEKQPNSELATRNGAPARELKVRNTLATLVARTAYGPAPAINKYLAILAVIIKEVPGMREKLLQYRKGKRVYFSEKEEEIHSSAQNVTVHKIPNESIFVLSTMDNRAKREILADICLLAGLNRSEAEEIVSSIQDSAKKRRSSIVDTLI